MHISKSCLTCFYTIFVTTVSVLGQFHGDLCTYDKSNTPGKCEYLETCNFARTELSKGIRPQHCSFDGIKPIVCCPTATSNSPEGYSNPPVRQNGSAKRISVIKCEEYKKIVTRQYTVGTLSVTSNDHKIQTTDCNVATSLIVGGERTKLGEFAHMAAIGWKNTLDETDFACGGSLISEKFVLTAAHCFRRRKENPNVVRLGDQNLETSDDGAFPVDFGILRLIPHENYIQSKNYYDIGLIELDGIVNFTKYIRPACLWQTEYQPARTAIATGWGLLEFAGRENSAELQKVTLNVLTSQECNVYFRGIRDEKIDRGIVDEQICAGSVQNNKLVGGKDTCNGDSGGPLQVNFNTDRCIHYLLGITSFSAVGCGNADSPGVYTAVERYLDWIENNVWNN